MRLFNDKFDHFLCHYTLVMDSFSRYCDIGCLYCYAKDFGTDQRSALSLSHLRTLFEDAFEHQVDNGISKILRKKIPIRLGFETDPFQNLEAKAEITLKVLQIFKTYRYPYIIFTKSPMCLEKKYLELYDRELTYIQVSISSPSIEMGQRLEPLAVNAYKRLELLHELEKRGIACAMRFNLLPQILHKGRDEEYYKSCVEFIKQASVQKVILNRITVQSKEKNLQLPFSPKDFYQLKEELQKKMSLTLCYLGSPAIDFYRFESKECDNCCQCDLSLGAKTSNLPFYLTDYTSHKDRITHFFRMGMLNTLSFTLKKGVV